MFIEIVKINPWIYYPLTTILLTAIILWIGVVLRERYNKRAKPIHFHHVYWGAILIAAILLLPIITYLKYELICLGTALIASDLIHHKMYGIKF